MTTLIERNPTIGPLLFLALPVVLLIGIGLEVAYLHGAFAVKYEIPAKVKLIEKPGAAPQKIP